MAADDIITVTFTHPRSEKTFAADLSRDIRASEVIQHLQSDAAKHFLAAGQKYVLVPKKSKRALAPSDTFEAAGVESSDIVEVQVTDIAGAPV